MKRPARAPLLLATVALAVAIVATFAVEVTGDGMGLCQRFGFVAANPSVGTALSALFVHDPRGWAHVLGNLVVLVVVGSRVEQAIGSTRVAALFFAGGLAGAALHVVVDPSSTLPLVGCSGSLFALLAVAATLHGPAMLAFTVVLALTNIAHAFGAPGAESVSYGAHLGGFALGVLAVVLARLHGGDLRTGLTRAAA